MFESEAVIECQRQHYSIANFIVVSFFPVGFIKTHEWQTWRNEFISELWTTY